jgi:hypothetical protein
VRVGILIVYPGKDEKYGLDDLSHPSAGFRYFNVQVHDVGGTCLNPPRNMQLLFSREIKLLRPSHDSCLKRAKQTRI